MDQSELERYYLDDYVFSGLDITALIILLLVAGMFCVLFVFLGGLPGRVARAKNHPDANAIRVGGWATLIMAGIGWPFVLMWAYRHTGESSDEEVADESDKFQSRINDLEQEVATLRREAVKEGEGNSSAEDQKEAGS
tara:strand:- start:805 stop:1218 length:414 start_codon:yes stop_codon:yes gene_type:complete